MYSRSQYEQDLRNLEQQRHNVRVLLLVKELAANGVASNEHIGRELGISPDEVAVYRQFPLSGPMEARHLLQACDQQERKLAGRLVGTRLALQDRDTMKRKYGAIFVFCTNKGWKRPVQGKWIPTSPKELASLSAVGNLVILLVPFGQMDWYKRRFEQFGWKIQAQAPRKRQDATEAESVDEQEAMPEIVTESRRTYQVIPTEVAREMARREQEALKLAMAKLPDRSKVTREEYNAAIKALPTVNSFLWGIDGDMTKAGLVVWEQES